MLSRRLVALVFLIAFLIFPSSLKAAGWEASITANRDGGGVSPIQLIFGENSEASDNQDSMDVVLPPIDFPSLPGQPTLSAGFWIKDPLFPKLKKDIKRAGEEHQWELKVNSDAGMILQWDVSQVPGDKSIFIRMEDGIVDLRCKKSLTLSHGKHELVLESASSAGFVSVVQSGPPTWRYKLTWTKGKVTNWRYIGSGITGARAPAGWTVVRQTDKEVIFCAEDIPLVSGSIDGFEIDGTRKGIGSYTCHGAQGDIEGSVETTVDADPPELTVLFPPDNYTTDTFSLTVRGTASDKSGIWKITVNGKPASGTENWSANITLREGSNIVTVIAYDNSVNHNTTVRRLTVRVIVPSESDWVMFHHDPQHTGYSPDIKIPSQVEKIWSYYCRGGYSPSIANGIVYLGTHNMSGDDVIAVDGEDGSLIWSYNFGGNAYVDATAPAVVSGIVYITGASNSNSNGTVYAFDAVTGSLKWSYTIGAHIFKSSPTVVNGKVYFGADDKKVYCLDANTGSEIWTFTTGSYVRSSPAVSNGIVYIGSDDHRLYALDADTGRLIWSYNTDNEGYNGSIQNAPAVSGGKVYFRSGNKYTYCLDAVNGSVIWKRRTDGGQSSVAVAYGKVYIADYQGTIYALDANSGGIIWSYNTNTEIASSPVIANNVLYIGIGGDKDADLLALDASTGSLLWSIDYGNRSFFSVPAIANGKVYIADQDFHLYAFGSMPIPSPPTLVSPSNGLTGRPISLTLSWNPSSGATSYRLVVDDNPDFSSPIFDQSNLTTTSKSISGLSYSTTYYWRVSASNSAGTSDWSEIWSFTTKHVHTVSKPYAPSGPSSGDVNQTLSFSAGGSSCSWDHQVQYQFDWGDENYSSWGPSTQSHSWSGAGTYTIRVRARCAVDTSIISDWSDGKIVTIRELTSIELTSDFESITCDGYTSFKVIAFYSDGSQEDVTSEASYRVISGSEYGKIEGLGLRGINNTYENKKVIIEASYEGKIDREEVIIEGSTPPPDTIPPSAVVDLTVSSSTSDSITLTWTAPGDDGAVGKASQYEIRYSTSSPFNWDAAIRYEEELEPQPAGSRESFTIIGLSPDTTYYFALKAADEVPNWSTLSNIAQGKTLAQEPRTWHVDDDFRDYPRADFTKIQDAVNAASPGDTIIVYPGTYTENVKVNKDHLTIRSEKKAETTIVRAANEDNHVFEVTADYVTIRGLSICGAKLGCAGIYLSGVEYCSIENNRCGWDAGKNNRGIWLDNVSNSILSNNICDSSYEEGIVLYSSDNNTISNNTCSRSKMFAIWLSCSNNNTVSSNLCNSSRNEGIYLSSSNNNTLLSNICSSNSNRAIFLFSSNGNTLSNNTCNQNNTGIWLENSSNNILSKNTCTLNGGGGIVLRYSDTNTLLNNSCTPNGGFGIFILSSSNNSIYLNSLTDAHSDSTNIWNSQEKITYTYNGKIYTNYLGNYWSNYKGSDADGDGIGDTPYSIDGDKDSYPLVGPWKDGVIEFLNQPPSRLSNPSPADGAADISTSPELSVLVTDPDGDPMTVTFYDASDDSVIGSVSEVASGTRPSVTWAGLDYGTEYSWYVKVSDGINPEVSSNTWSFTTTVDSLPPETTISISGTAGDNNWYISDVTLTLFATDTGSGVKETKYKIGSGSWQDYSSPSTISTEGITTIYYYSVDNADNQEDERSREIKIDKTKPTGSISINNGAETANSAPVTLTLSASDAISGMGEGAQMRFSNDGDTWSTPEPFSTTKQWTLSSGDGTKTVYVKYKDVAGNWSDAFSDTILLDTTPPSILSKEPEGGNVLPTSEIKVAFSEEMDQNSAGKAFTITPQLEGEITWKGNTLIFNPRAELEQNTEYTVKITGIKDRAGNPVSTSWSFTTGLFGDVAPLPGKDGREQGDGKVNIGDALRVARIGARLVSPTPLDLIFGDVAPSPGPSNGPNNGKFGDGKLNVGDALRIARYAVGLIDKEDFPARKASPPTPPRPAYADLKQLRIVVEKTAALQDGIANVNIRLVDQSPISSVGAIQFTLGYDPLFWSIAGNPIKGELLKGAVLITNPRSFPSDSGDLIISLFTLAQNGLYQENDDLLVTIPFQALTDNPPGEMDVKLEIEVATDINGGSIPIRAEGGRILILNKDLPADTALLQNYPNPFNLETWIPFQLAEESDVVIRIYDIEGRLIRTLNLGRKPPGFYLTKDRAAYWRGLNRNGERVASGVYFCEIQAGNYKAIRRMTIEK
ncbi:PQQ-binding-like beta-propeller repeat protein [Candidatus Poribacteria bacterium]|nr:PQQ-binding-like beta-propeller repeat protein [Candidatus Poribacteria bacterium]